MNHLHKIETESFASLYMSAAAALVEEHDFEGKIALRQCIRLYGTRLGQLRRNMLVNAGQKTNLEHIFDNGWGIPCGDGAIREWIERGEQQLLVNVLACPFAQIWKQSDPFLGHVFCEEFYPAYVKAATDPNAQVNLGKTLLNEGDAFCRLSCYLRPSNLELKQRKECFVDYDPAFQEQPWQDTPMTDLLRCDLLRECFRQTLTDAGLTGKVLNTIGGI